MYNELSKLKEQRSMIAIYTNENDGNAFSVGYICELNQDKILLLNVGVHGEFDGYTAMYIDDIFRIESDSKYLDKMQKLKSFVEDDKIITTVQDFFGFLIEKALDNDKILAIQYNNDCEIKGLVSSLNDVFSIVEIDEYGYEDGSNVINMSNINRIVIDDVECRDLEKLYKIRRGDGSIVLTNK